MLNRYGTYGRDRDTIDLWEEWRYKRFVGRIEILGICGMNIDTRFYGMNTDTKNLWEKGR